MKDRTVVAMSFVSMGLSILGAVINGIAVKANGGKMPVFAEGVNGKDKEAGNTGWPRSSRHVLMTESSRCKNLCDIFPVKGVGVCSIGDIFMVSAVLVGIITYASLGSGKD